MKSRGPLPQSGAQHRLKATFRPVRHAGPVPPTAPGTLGKPPAELNASGRKLWYEIAAAAPWLAAIDRQLTGVYVEAILRWRIAVAELQAAREVGEGPGVLDPIERQVRRAATDIRETSRTLALAPTVRARLLTAATDEAGKSADPWASFKELRVVRGGKG